MRRLLSVLLLVAGCDGDPAPPPSKKVPEPGVVSPSESTHHHEAPHGGKLVELGDHFANLELILEGPTGTVRCFVLDAHAENSIRLEQTEIVLRGKNRSVSLQAVGSPLTGEKSGDTSWFEGQSDGLKDAGEFDGVVVRVVIKGREFSDVPLRLKARPKED